MHLKPLHHDSWLMIIYCSIFPETYAFGTLPTVNQFKVVKPNIYI